MNKGYWTLAKRGVMEGGIVKFYKRYWFALLGIPIRIITTVVQFYSIQTALRILSNFEDMSARDFKVLIASVIVFFAFELFKYVCIMLANYYRYVTITKSSKALYKTFDAYSYKNPAKVLKIEPMQVQKNLHLIYWTFSNGPGVILGLQNQLIDFVLYSLIFFVLLFLSSSFAGFCFFVVLFLVFYIIFFLCYLLPLRYPANPLDSKFKQTYETIYNGLIFEYLSSVNPKLRFVYPKPLNTILALRLFFAEKLSRFDNLWTIFTIVQRILILVIVLSMINMRARAEVIIVVIYYFEKTFELIPFFFARKRMEYLTREKLVLVDDYVSELEGLDNVKPTRNHATQSQILSESNPNTTITLDNLAKSSKRVYINDKMVDLLYDAIMDNQFTLDTIYFVRGHTPSLITRQKVFERLILKISNSGTRVVVLEKFDEYLDDEDSARFLSWIQSQFPPDVVVVVSSRHLPKQQ